MTQEARRGPRIVFTRTGPLNLTPAVERHVAFLRAQGFAGEILGLELDFQPNRTPVGFVDGLTSLRASYRNTAERMWMLLRWQVHQLRHLLRLRPDVVQICDVFSALPALAAKWVRGAKLIYDVRDPARLTVRHWGRVPSALLGWLEDFAAARSDVVVQVSEPLKGLLDPATQMRTVVIPNAPQSDSFDAFSFSSDGNLRVSLAGFISHSRNLGAWCELARSEPDVILDLYGAVYDEETRRILRQFGHAEPKSLSHQDAMRRMAASDLVSIMYDPAVEVNRYTAPNKFYDALMLGKPIVCADGLLLAEEVRGAGCGIVVPYGNAAALSRGIALLRDAASRARMGASARQHFERTYLGSPGRARAKVYRMAGVLEGTP